MSEIYSFEVSMQDILNRLDLMIYPNPVSTSLNLKLPLEMMQGNYMIMDGTGRLVLKGLINDLISKIDISQLGSGMYTLIIEKNDFLKSYNSRKSSTKNGSQNVIRFLNN